LAIDATEKLIMTNVLEATTGQAMIAKYKQKLAANTEYIKRNGVDMDDIASWRWTR
jgi:phosphoketolase